MYLNLNFPPLPFHIDTGPATLTPGISYLSREKIDNFDLLVVFTGELHVWEDGKTYDIKAGEFLILEPNKKHYGYKPVTEETYFYWCHFDIPGEYTISTEKQSHFNVDIHDVHRIHLLSIPKYEKLQNEQTVYKHLKKLTEFFTHTNSIFKLEQQILLHQILLKLANQSDATKTPQVIKIAEETIHFLEQNLKEDITYDTLSKELHLSSAYITRCVKKTYNCTPLEYLQKIRMETAVNLLISTNFSIEEVAIHAGYKTASYFSKTFSDTYGISPLKYRKNHFTDTL